MTTLNDQITIADKFRPEPQEQVQRDNGGQIDLGMDWARRQQPKEQPGEIAAMRNTAYPVAN